MHIETWKRIKLRQNDDKYDYYISDTGKVKNYRTGKILKYEVDKDGYFRVHLGGKHYFVHRLVAAAFIPNQYEYPQVNHIDGIKTHNYVANLEWCDCLYNIRHAISTGLRKNPPQGDLHWASKYNREDIIKVCEMLQSGKYTIKEISNIVKIPESEIKHIKSKKRWKDLTKKYDFTNVKTYHIKFSKFWKLIDYYILKKYKRKIIINFLIERGLTKNQAINAFKVRQRYLKHKIFCIAVGIQYEK